MPNFRCFDPVFNGLRCVLDSHLAMEPDHTTLAEGTCHSGDGGPCHGAVLIWDLEELPSWDYPMYKRIRTRTVTFKYGC